jgi:hypothetical protein
MHGPMSTSMMKIVVVVLLLLMGQGGPIMPGPGGVGTPAPAFVQGENNTNDSTNSVSQAFDSSNTAGNLIVAGSGTFSTPSATTPVFSDTKVNTYASTPNSTVFNGQTRSAIAYAPTILAGSNTVEAVYTLGQQNDLVITEFSGVNTLDQQAQSFCTSCGSTMTTPSITITQREMVVSYIYDVHSSHTWSVPAGWTICAKCFSQNTVGGESSAIAYQLLNAGTYSLAWTNNGSASTTGTVYFIESFK